MDGHVCNGPKEDGDVEGGVRNHTDDFCERTREPNPGITGPLLSLTQTGDGNRPLSVSVCLSVCLSVRPALSSPQHIQVRETDLSLCLSVCPALCSPQHTHS